MFNQRFLGFLMDIFSVINYQFFGFSSLITLPGELLRN
ncbi:hypothetical protein CWATWH0402_5041 [Crocosphaera watsonii WH 0402]|uniref:Uncharacterized protein n=1 Tax=Crocosphaera watsonii WH 0402 TaxID=1284629 RepID=T2JVC0_CROWT|nr:hypothetical protein CWATWH0402_5041 [Crocosphaera watsonii WH 0402]